MREKYIDYTKGFAIILMLFGHTMTRTNQIHMWIYSFHMPIFFIVCGILLSEKHYKSLKSAAWKRVYTAGIPYYIWGSILAIFYSILDIFSRSPISFGEKMLRLISLQGIDSLWFLPVYILASIGIMILNEKATMGGGRLITILFALSYIVAAPFLSLNWYMEVISKICIGICFIEIGFVIAKFNIIEKLPLWGDVFLLIMGYILARINGEVEMSAGNIGNPFLYFLCASVTSVAIMSLLKKNENNTSRMLDILGIYGKYSMIILCTNNLLIEIIRLCDYKITGNILISLGMFGCIMFTLILMVLEWLIIKFSEGKLGVLFGKLKTVNIR